MVQLAVAEGGSNGGQCRTCHQHSYLSSGAHQSTIQLPQMPLLLYYSHSHFCSFSSLLLLYLTYLDFSHGLGSMSTISTSFDDSGNMLVCSLLQSSSIQCWSSISNSVILASPSHAPFLGLSGDNGILCALRLDTGRPICWSSKDLDSPHRLKDAPFTSIATGGSFVCALSAVNAIPLCWRNSSIISSVPSQLPLLSIASGSNFACGLGQSGQVYCWGDLNGSFRLPNATFQSIQVGTRHACGLTEAFNVQCWGDNTQKQCEAPLSKQFLELALGDSHSCGIDAFTRIVLCWGDSIADKLAAPIGLPFVAVVASNDFTCGVLYSNFSILCWGGQFGRGMVLPLKRTLPNFCNGGECRSGSFQLQSDGICGSHSQHVCIPCRIGCLAPSIQTSTCEATGDISCSAQGPYTPSLSPAPAMPPLQASFVVIKFKATFSKGHIALTALGALGSLCGLLAMSQWVCVNRQRHAVSDTKFHPSKAQLPNSVSLGAIKRQRSSTSSMRSRVDAIIGKGEAFSIAEMEAATMGFSEEFKIATGSFGVVYRGMLPDGREIAIKRGIREAANNDKHVEEKESAFQSELELLSRLHHKHLVSLVGYCDENEERMLVYEYMPNGTLHDHLHGKRGVRLESGSLPWQMRIKIALEAARGVEYLHTYALPPIIHRDIKSSNILLDGGWSARVSDFGLSMHSPGENSHFSLMAAGTLGYMDPEYYRLQHLTIKSDVYSFGVVLLELLTGERAIHRHSHGPMNIVDFAVPKIDQGDLVSVLDQRPGTPAVHELKALEIIGNLASRCVRLESKDRPTMIEIVDMLEEAMGYVSSSRSWSESMAAAIAPPEVRLDNNTTMMDMEMYYDDGGDEAIASHN